MNMVQAVHANCRKIPGSLVLPRLLREAASAGSWGGWAAALLSPHPHYPGGIFSALVSNPSPMLLQGTPLNSLFHQAPCGCNCFFSLLLVPYLERTDICSCFPRKSYATEILKRYLQSHIHYSIFHHSHDMQKPKQRSVTTWIKKYTVFALLASLKRCCHFRAAWMKLENIMACELSLAPRLHGLIYVIFKSGTYRNK